MLYCDDREIDRLSKPCGLGTNNEAEWRGLLALLDMALTNNVRELEVYGDSMLVIMQAKRKWRIKTEHLFPYMEWLKHLEQHFDRLTFHWIPRAQNGRADYLAGQPLRVCRGFKLDQIADREGAAKGVALLRAREF